MAHIYVSMVIEAPVEEVWSVARDFTGNWHSSVIADSEIEGGLPSDAVGCVRNFSLADGGGQLREQLVGLSDERHEFAYRILDSPLPVSEYLATARFTPITTSGQTFGEWWVDFRVAPEDEQGTVELVRGVFEAGLSDLAGLTASA
ncbi:MAG: SRPBCC family protein [Nitriliruptoraceae bacterium]